MGKRIQIHTMRDVQPVNNRGVRIGCTTISVKKLYSKDASMASIKITTKTSTNLFGKLAQKLSRAEQPLIAIGLFNDHYYFLSSNGASCGYNGHEYADKMDEARIAMSDRRASESAREPIFLKISRLI